MPTRPDDPLSAPRIEQMRTALRNADPDAELSVDLASGQLNIVTSLPSHEVLAVLGKFGPKAELVDEGLAERDAAQGGCCGCCGH